jgi:integrase
MLTALEKNGTAIQYKSEDICMRGRIFSDQKCPICGGTFEHDDRRRGLFCPDHPEQTATGRFRVQFGRKTRKRFSIYREAERFLDGLRWEVDQGTFDPRDYRTDYPLGFEALALKWLQVKKNEVKRKSYNNLNNYMDKAIAAWGQRNVKTIGFGEVQDFLNDQKVSDKTKANMKSGLHSFFVWVNKREKIPMPDLPEVSYELAWRQTVNKDTQQAIIDEVYNISYKINPKIWIGIKWLATYISIRPKEIINLREKDISIETGYIFIPHPKEKKAKAVPMLHEDIDLVREFPKALPDIFFFRHTVSISGCRAGDRFGEKYLYKWWKKACNKLGIEGVDLYGGTRHSSAMALRQYVSPEEIRRATMHSTNKAFERYFRIESDEVRNIYQLTLSREKQKKRNTNSH